MRKIPRFRPERPTQSPVCRPFRPLIIGSRFPVAHATGIGYVGPPGLKRATSKSVSEGILGENKQPKPLADASGYKVSAIGREPSGTSFLYRQADACRSPVLSIMATSNEISVVRVL